MNYENFRSVVTSRTRPWFYRDLLDRYEFESYEGTIEFRCTIYKSNATVTGIDPTVEAERVADFDENYKDTIGINIT